MNGQTRIEEWCYATTNAYTPPEFADIEIRGKCFNHPNLPDGSNVSTGVSLAGIERFISRSGRVWTLGEPGEFHPEGPMAGEEVTPEGFLACFGKISMGRQRAGNPITVEKKEAVH